MRTYAEEGVSGKGGRRRREGVGLNSNRWLSTGEGKGIVDANGGSEMDGVTRSNVSLSGHAGGDAGEVHLVFDEKRKVASLTRN